jgi:hypothetical protein
LADAEEEGIENTDFDEINGIANIFRVQRAVRSVQKPSQDSL